MASPLTRLCVGLAGLLGILVATLTDADGDDSRAVAPLPTVLVQRVVTPTELVATVGDQMILAGDVLPSIDQMLKDAASKIPAGQLDQQRALFVQQLLPRKIEVKLVMLDFYRTIPADKRNEVLGNIDKQVEKQFFDAQVPVLMEQLEVESLTQLDAKLRSFGTSIGTQKSEFREQMMARTIIGDKINRTPEITHEQLLEYYREHSSEYDIPARARWEKLTARFDKYPDKAAADRAIVEMGNQVLRGAEFAAVARKLSQGTNATNGGYHDWTTKGSLVSEVIDQAIFTLPLHRLSPKLEDDRGFHIVRVTERQEAGRIEFLDAQQEIRNKLQEEDRKRQVRDYLDGLRKDTYVWTIFDELEVQTASRPSPFE